MNIFGKEKITKTLIIANLAMFLFGCIAEPEINGKMTDQLGNSLVPISYPIQFSTDGFDKNTLRKSIAWWNNSLAQRWPAYCETYLDIPCDNYEPNLLSYNAKSNNFFVYRINQPESKHLGWTILTWNTNSQIVKAEIAMNNDDVQTLNHELGHAFGLSHSTCERNSRDLMCATRHDGNLHITQHQANLIFDDWVTYLNL